MRASLFIFKFSFSGFTFEWTFFYSPLKLKQHGDDWWKILWYSQGFKIRALSSKIQPKWSSDFQGRKVKHMHFFFSFLCRDPRSPSSRTELAAAQLPFTKLRWAASLDPIRWVKEERRFRAELGVRSSEEDEPASGGRRGGTRRQMPPPRLWRFRILIARGHIVPTLLEMWAASCWASVTR